jgi:predicted  nucleic acid-binding Zn-ribbon protein
MLDWLKTIFGKDPIKEFEKLSAEELRRNEREIDYEIEGAMAESKQKEEEIEKQINRGADASEIEVDTVSENCAMIEEEIRAINAQIVTLRNLKYAAHTMYVLKKYSVGIVKGVREEFQKMIGAKSLDELVSSLKRIQTTSNIESDEIGKLADDLRAQVSARAAPLSKTAEKYKKEIMALKAVESRAEREQMAKEKAKEMLKT